jgi:hypothetical protein
MTLTGILAAYGAILSTVVFLWNASRGVAAIEVGVCFGLWTSHDRARNAGGYVVVSLLNKRSVPVQARSLGMLIPHRPVTMREKVLNTIRYRKPWRQTCWLNTWGIDKFAGELPVVIQPFQSIDIWIPDKELGTGWDRLASAYST